MIDKIDLLLYAALFAAFAIGAIVSRFAVYFFMDKIGYEWTAESAADYIRRCVEERDELDEDTSNQGISINMMSRFSLTILICTIIAVLAFLVVIDTGGLMKLVFVYASLLGVLLGCIIALLQEWRCAVCVVRLKRMDNEILFFQDILNDGIDGAIIISKSIFEDTSELEVNDIVLIVAPGSGNLIACVI